MGGSRFSFKSGGQLYKGVIFILIHKGGKHCFSLVYMDFAAITPFDIRDCYYFRSKGGFKLSAHYGCIRGRGSELSSFPDAH